eukprot:TRINITY_DN4283_c0_g1_i2.p1 TRINITY_DN4283_c0_g1~~TRINITY_DN4283_c0_g1_i2.p1  ORF type:complete len:336 (+),score=64.68 TRINITY_DN4283_c0_g1_i2:110-1117(+)
MLRSLVGSEMCIRDRYQRRVREVWRAMSLEAELIEFEQSRADLHWHLGANMETWVKQFDSGQDQALGLLLAKHLKIIGQHEFRQVLRKMHQWLLAQPGVELDKVVFSSFAYGKSGALVQYYYRTSNWLHYCQNIPFNSIGDPKSADGHPKRQHMPDPDTLVVLDDFVGEGSEAMNYFQLCKKELQRYKRVFYMTVVGFEHGIQNIQDLHPEVTVKAHYVERKLFDPCNSTFTEPVKLQLQGFLNKYQHRVYPDADMDPDTPYRKPGVAHAFGYHAGESMIGFFYNTQSNTLPIFWSVYKGWTPIFQRFDSYNRPEKHCHDPVSYTHLTLPTKRIV